MDTGNSSSQENELEHSPENQNSHPSIDDPELDEDEDGPIFTGKSWRRLKILLVVLGLVGNIATRFALVSSSHL